MNLRYALLGLMLSAIAVVVGVWITTGHSLGGLLVSMLAIRLIFWLTKQQAQKLPQQALAPTPQPVPGPRDQQATSPVIVAMRMKASLAWWNQMSEMLNCPISQASFSVEETRALETCYLCWERPGFRRDPANPNRRIRKRHKPRCRHGLTRDLWHVHYRANGQWWEEVVCRAELDDNPLFTQRIPPQRLDPDAPPWPGPGWT